MAEPLGWDELFDLSKSGWDSVGAFFSVAQLLASRSRTVVDVGCGRGGLADNLAGPAFCDLRGAGRHVIGIDVDPAGTANPMIDEFRLIPAGGRWPLDDASADLAVSDWVLEHVDDPPAFVAELARVLRPGGVFVARTVSRHSPLSLAARAVPNERHAHWLGVLGAGRQSRDVFPTRYRMNTERGLHAVFDAQFECRVLHRAGLDRYLLRWPRLARSVMAVEPHLPKAVQMALVVYARRRGTPASAQE